MLKNHWNTLRMCLFGKKICFYGESFRWAQKRKLFRNVHLFFSKYNLSWRYTGHHGCTKLILVNILKKLTTGPKARNLWFMDLLQGFFGKTEKQWNTVRSSRTEKWDFGKGGFYKVKWSILTQMWTQGMVSLLHMVALVLELDSLGNISG